MDPATMALIAALVNAGTAAYSGMSQGGQTEGQKRDSNTINDLLASVQGGGGKYSNLFANDYDAFQKSYVDPSMSRFKNIIAPGIQQEYIATGQQRGTGLDDSLARAGVDLQSNIDAKFADYQQSGLDRKLKALMSTYGQGQAGQQSGNKFGQVAGGFASSEGGQDLMNKILGMFAKNQNSQNNNYSTTYSGERTDLPNSYWRD